MSDIDKIKEAIANADASILITFKDDSTEGGLCGFMGVEPEDFGELALLGIDVLDNIVKQMPQTSGEAKWIKDAVKETLRGLGVPEENIK
jgi:hypothetical protein